VIVPTHHRPAQLLRCLGALARQDYPRDDYEVVVVDDAGAGDDDVAAAIDQFRRSNDVTVTLVSQRSSGGPAVARNAGAAAARGRHLAFTDDDCEPRADWLSRLACHLREHPSAAVGGLIINSLPSVPYSTASQLLIDYLYDYYHVELSGARFFTSNNLAMAVDGFRSIGGFDESFPLAAAEDREFCERWQRAGRRLVYAEDAVVYHGHRLDLRQFIRQHFNYGRGADYLHRSRARHTGAPVRPNLEPVSFYVNLLRFPLRSGISWRALPLVGLMSLSQIAYASGYFAERFKRAVS
jgi:GT2 family glycosyltransferase